MNKDTSENKKVSEVQFLASLLNNHCAGSTTTGDKFGGILISYDDAAIIVSGRRGTKTFIKRVAIASIYEVG
jgi:hypothetical protein